MFRYKVKIDFLDGTTEEFDADDVRLNVSRLTWKRTDQEYYWTHRHLNKIAKLSIEHIGAIRPKR